MSTDQNNPRCEPPTLGSTQSDSGPKEAAWPFDSLIEVDGAQTLEITIQFLKDVPGYTDKKREAVWNSIKKEEAEKGKTPRETWEHHANISFREEPSGKAHIRVGFDRRDGSWSYIGRNADKFEGVTLNLGNIDIYVPPLDNDFGTILHEFGHALGLLHEHQSPLRGSNVDKMMRNRSSEYARRFGSAKLVENQMLEAVEEGSIMNISTFDQDSIMMYQIDGVTDKPNTKLSTLDKAFIMLNYPPDLTNYGDPATEKRLSRFKTAMRTAGVEIRAGQILQAFQNPGPVLNLPSGTNPTIPDRLQAVRKRFTEYNATMYLRRSNVNISRSLNPASGKQYALPGLGSDPPFGLTDPTLARQYGLTDPLGNVVKNKLFQSLVKHLVKNALVQHGIPMQSIPGASPTEIVKMMAAIGAHDNIAQHIEAYKNDFKGTVPHRTQDRKDDAEKQK